ncbi:MAG: cell division protein FtsL [Cellvibrionaceae bacterium]|nr:cell division protein FtsL [Cellvibrionaceae bacterium]
MEAMLGDINWRWLAVVAVLWLLVIVSAVAVINVTHSSRIKLNQLELERRQANDYQVAWGQYLLEQSALATYNRVESVAAKQLKMKTPATSEMVLTQ